jgi:microcystin-dependent protein
VSEFFLGQIMMTGFGFAPKYWAQCNGQILGIAQNQALFSLLGTTYGGDGRTTFALPDLRSRTPAGGITSSGGGWNPPQYLPGMAAGVENVTLLQTEMPVHTHIVNATTATATQLAGSDTVTLSATDPSSQPLYGAPTTMVPLAGGPLTPAGGTQPHPNIQPYETINFNIALSGIFPSRG